MKISIEVRLGHEIVGEVVGGEEGVVVRLRDRVFYLVEWETLKYTVDAALARCVRAREAVLL